MRLLSDTELTAAMSPGRDLRLRVDAFLGADRVLERLYADAPGEGGRGVPWSVSWSLAGENRLIATVALHYADDHGGSLLPRDFRSRLTPFGTTLHLALEVRAGAQTVTIPAGEVRVDDIPTAYDAGRYFLNGRAFTLGSYLVVGGSDMLSAVRDAGFTDARLAPQASTCWDEIARLTGMKVTRNVSDRPVPGGMEYERAQGGRLDAIDRLADHLGGVIMTDPTGALTIVSAEETDPLWTLDQRVTLTAPVSVSADGVYNEVCGNFSTEAGDPIIVPPAQIVDGPLRVNGPFGRRTRYYASEFVQTRAAAESAVAKILAQESRPTFARDFTALLDPRVELGDTGTIVHDGEHITGVVEALEWHADGTMSGTLRVRGEPLA